ncbi:MAG: hypothetical protein IJU19_05300 [Bacteroidales bacterium]|nr:hypothetical protein [Bacteroidales bacterium]
MSQTHKLLLLATLASTLVAACKDDPIEIPEPSPRQVSHTVIADSAGRVITDSLTISFGSKHWATLDYTARIDTLTSIQGLPQEWLTVEAHHPGGEIPYMKLIMLCEQGTQTATLSITDPGTGYTVPGQMVRGIGGGDLYYCDSLEIKQYDGTIWTDWRPLRLTTTVLEYDSYLRTLTATADAVMFHYAQWLDSTATSHPINVAEADTCSIAITFGRLKAN